jgi:hypothetical protein
LQIKKDSLIFRHPTYPQAGDKCGENDWFCMYVMLREYLLVLAFSIEREVHLEQAI